MTDLSLESLWKPVAACPEQPFLVTPHASMTYRALGAAVRAQVARFDAAGLSPGSRVLIRVADEAGAIVLFVAALLDGLVPVMLAPGTPDMRLNAIAAAVEPGLTCLSAPTDAVEATRDPRLPEAPDATAYILFTSGTTQAPSGVTITQRNLLANLATISRLFGIDAASRIFNDMVLAHADGLVQGPLLALAGCATLIRSGGFALPSMEAWLGRVAETRATHVITVPTVWSLIDRYARLDSYFRTPDCRALMSVAARLDPALWERLESRFGRTVYNQYGLTETVTSALYAGPHPEMGARGTIGKPVDCAARVIVPAGGEAAIGDVGELQVRGDNVFRGYWKNDTRTADSFTPDGWLKTGDLARCRADGSYEIMGRIKTIIMMAGFLIRPEEIDEAMMRHPAVAESVSVSIPNLEFGEVPVTAVVLKATASEAELTAHAQAALEALKVPKRIIAVPAIPRGISGKPELKVLQQQLIKDMQDEQVTAAPDQALAADVLKLASRVFRIDPAELDLASAPGAVPGWDSFSHVTLVLAAETRFGVEIGAESAAAITSLGDLVAAIATRRLVSPT